MEQGWGDHLGELRKRAIAVAAVYVFSFLVSFCFSAGITDWLMHVALPGWGVEYALVALHPLDAFFIRVRVANALALLAAFPVFTYNTIRFVVPALSPREVSLLRWSAAGFVFLFSLGSAAGYLLVARLGLGYLSLYSREIGLINLWSGRAVISFLTNACIVSGLVFQLPLVVLLLKRFGIVDAGTLGAYRRVAYVVSFAVAAVLTPPDPISQIALAIPLILLYEVTMLISRSSRKI
ncbi:MAG: twin-arginine translocase subunit TatC [archaeon]